MAHVQPVKCREKMLIHIQTQPKNQQQSLQSHSLSYVTPYHTHCHYKMYMAQTLTLF